MRELVVEMGQKHLDESSMIDSVDHLRDLGSPARNDRQYKSARLKMGPKPSLTSPLLRCVGEVAVRIARPRIHSSLTDSTFDVRQEPRRIRCLNYHCHRNAPEINFARRSTCAIRETTVCIGKQRTRDLGVVSRAKQMRSLVGTDRIGIDCGERSR